MKQDHKVKKATKVNRDPLVFKALKASVVKQEPREQQVRLVP